MSALRGAAIAWLAVIAAGCAVHAPVSQMVMFRPADTTVADAAGIGLSATHNLTSIQPVARGLQPDSVADDVFNRYERSLAGYAGHFHPSGNFGFAVSAGPAVLGTDITARLYDDTYLTIIGSMGGAGARLQQRLVHRPTFGLAAGVGYQREQYTVDGDYNLAVEQLYANAVVVHVVGLHRPSSTYGGGLRFGLTVGYVPEARRPTVQLSVSVGGF
jgi:hypothetical protein